MAIHTLMRDSIASMDLIMEYSDSGKFFFSGKRPDPKRIKLYYTFDMKDTPGCILELIRERIESKDGLERFLSVEFQINPDNRIITNRSGQQFTKAAACKEIWNAYKFVKIYKGKIDSDEELKNQHPKLALCLAKVDRFNRGIFRKSYDIFNY